MSWANRKGFNFRSTLGFVTDGANETFVNDAFGAYPQSKTVDGDTFNCGWETAPVAFNSRDRSAAVDVRLAGMVFVGTGQADCTFRIDLPSAGDYAIRLALGDQGSNNVQKAQIRDTTTAVITIAETSTLIDEFIDANGVKRTSDTDWVTNEVEVTKTFATTICRIFLQNPSNSSVTIAHFSIYRVSGVSNAQRAMHLNNLMRA